MTASRTAESYTPTEILAGDYPLASRPETAGGAIAAGVIVGRITASGKLIPSVKTAADGSQTPIGIAATAASADGDPVVVYTSGNFDAAHVGLSGRTLSEAQIAFDRTPITITSV